MTNLGVSKEVGAEKKAVLSSIQEKSRALGIAGGSTLLNRGIKETKSHNLKIELYGEIIASIPKKLVDLSFIIEKSKYLLELKDNWDGEGAEGYDPQTWIRAVKFICNYATRIYHADKKIIIFPVVYHGPSGSIDLLWETDKYNLLFNFPKAPDSPANFYGDNYQRQKIEGVFDPENFQPTLMPSFVYEKI